MVLIAFAVAALQVGTLVQVEVEVEVELEVLSRRDFSASFFSLHRLLVWNLEKLIM